MIAIRQEPIANCDRLSGGEVENRILTVRGEQVILDSDLAMLYGTVTKRFNEQVQRNINRFPTTFMFQLTKEEFEYLRSQNAATNLNKRRSLPYAFTEHGVIMAAAILKSEIADKASVKVVEAFVEMRRFLAANASAESFNAKVKAFRLQFRGVRDIPFFIFSGFALSPHLVHFLVQLF